MSASHDDLSSIRRELEDLKKRIDLLEVDLSTRIAAAEDRHHTEISELKRLWNNITVAVHANTRMVDNLATQQRASHYALVHLLAVTARAVKAPDSDLTEAMRMAEEAMK